MDPLFIRFANNLLDTEDIIRVILDGASDDRSHEIASKAMEDQKSTDLSVFRRDFRNMLTDLIENGVNQHLINYVNSYMKPSLEEFVEGTGGTRAGEKRNISLKAEDAPWMEAVVCYNLCIYIRVYNTNSIKNCPVCSKFFTHKGKYAKYCSDSCKSKGKS